MRLGTIRETLLGLGLFAVGMTLGSGCERPAIRPDAALAAAPLYTLSEGEVDRYLAKLSRDEPCLTDRAAAIARKSIGQPYRLGLLGEGPFDPHDPDPLYCLSASDCVTFVEQTYAMALSHDWPSFMATLQRIRYRNGEIGFLNRNHFTEADWNRNNGWLFDDVTDRLAGHATAPMRVDTDRRAFFSQFGVRTEFNVESIETTYVPRDRSAEVEPGLRTGDVIEFVRGTAERPYVGHMGIAIYEEPGPVLLIHSGQPAVQSLPLGAYLDQHAVFIGIKVLRPGERATPVSG